jgi:hypothetical protein
MKQVLLIFTLLACWASPSFSQCSIFAVSDEDVILVGNNEDYGPARKRIWIHPPEEGTFGTIMFGFDEGFNNYEGGVNDQGLFIDGAALPPTGWAPDPDRETVGIDVLFETILGTCKDCEDIERLVNKFNITSLQRAQFLVVDKKGKCGVMVWHDGKQRLIRMSRNHQLVTNFHYCEGDDPYRPDRRYMFGSRMLEDPGNHSIDGFKKILFAMHQDAQHGAPTSYSNIYDLKNNKVYIYNFYNYFEPYTIDMEKAFSGTKPKTIDFSDIFESGSFVSENHYVSRLISGMVKMIEEKGFKDTMTHLPELEKEYTMTGSLSGIDFDRLGYALIEEKMFPEAIEVFRYNSDRFPDRPDILTYLAEAYQLNGDTAKAIRSCRKALELDPESSSAEELLQKLEQ